MSSSRSYHSICRWTFHAGKGGFLPSNIRPSWGSPQFGTEEMIHLTANAIRKRVPEFVELGIELHYDNEVNEESAPGIARALGETQLKLAMITPGLHGHFAYGGPASVDPRERAAANDFSQRTIDLAYGPLREAWHAAPELAPTLVLWNGSYGYDVATPAIATMYRNLLRSFAELCHYERERGGALFIGLEPKPNEGHPAMFIPTVASAITFWRKLSEEFGVELQRTGVNMELGHSEMIGLDHVHDAVEQLESNMMVHIHLNSQGYNDGIIFGGPGKYDIDHGVRINGMNIALARVMHERGYSRWKGHDMQPRPYDNEAQAIDRVVRSILSWEACEAAGKQLDLDQLHRFLEARQTARAEDLMREAVVFAHQWFDEHYRR